MRTKVLIADDQALVRTGFRKILETEPDLEVVGEAADGAQAVECALRLRPDVVLMDIRMPGVDGLEATRRLAGRARILILILTTFDLNEYVYKALRSDGPAASCSRMRWRTSSSVTAERTRPS